MMRRPALRLATLPLPPAFFAARFFAAAIRPPLVFFMLPPVRETSTIARRVVCKHLARETNLSRASLAAPPLFHSRDDAAIEKHRECHRAPGSALESLHALEAH